MIKFNKRQASTPLELQHWTDLYNFHHDRFMGSRHVYYSKRAESRHKMVHVVSRKVLRVTMIMDAMEQAKLKLPWSGRQCSKTYLSSWRPALRVIIVLVHGYCECYYLVDETAGKGPNGSCEFIRRTLLHLEDHIALGDVAHFDFVLDNCPSENKNKTTHSFVASLVPEMDGDAASSALNYLVTGHTHEDVDGRGGQISRHCRKQGVTMQTPEDLVHEIRVAIGPSAASCGHALYVEEVRDIYNYEQHLRERGGLYSHVGIQGPMAAHVWRYAKRPGHTADWVTCSVAHWMGTLSQGEEVTAPARDGDMEMRLAGLFQVNQVCSVR